MSNMIDSTKPIIILLLRLLIKAIEFPILAKQISMAKFVF